jgi:D-alanyl-D-alanine carboxypeptidase/D-alanyl-D-alanine-endopeptidase (penicillin-binding protein 4)
MRRSTTLLAAAALLLLLAVPAPRPAAAAPAGAKAKSRAAKSAPTRAIRGPKAVAASAKSFRTAIVHPSLRDTTFFASLDRLRATRPLKRGTTAIYVVDARTGEEIYAVHEDEPMNPASNVKLISTAAVMHYLGPDWRFDTRLFGPTPDARGVLLGDVYLRGSWDPTLTVSHLDDFGAQLVERGISRIEGDVLVGPRARRDSVFAAKYQVVVMPGAKVGDPAIVKVDAPPTLIDLVNTAVTGRGKLTPIVKVTEVADAAGQVRIQVAVSGKVAIGRPRTTKHTPNLPAFTGHGLRAALERAGITITGQVRTAEFADYVQATASRFLPVELAVHRSIDLAAMISMINKRSINGMADRLTRLAGALAYGGEPSMDKGVRLMKRWLADTTGITEDQVVLDTGSGLSYKTQLSARQVVRVLREGAGYCDSTASHHHDPQVDKLFRRSLSVAGIDGTLRGRYGKSLVRGKLVGKTGTLTGIISLAGFIGANGRELAFAIITNGHVPAQRPGVRDEQRLMVETMYRYLLAHTASR